MNTYFRNKIDFIMKVYNLVEGKINLTKSPIMIKLITKEKNVAYIDSNGIFFINILKLKSDSDIDKTIILDIVCHELSHLDQKVDYNRYNNDIEYNNYIEKTNIDRVYNFIIDNKYILESQLDFKINMNYMNHIKNWFK